MKGWVSCIMPINKDRGFFEKAVSSILNQSYEKLELIIIANNCNEILWQHIQSFTDDRVRSFRSEIEQIPYARNLAIDHAKGEYIAIMDSDDISLPERFAKQVEFLESNPGYHIIGSDFEAIDDHDHPYHHRRNFYETHQDITNALPITCAMIHPTIMMRKSLAIALKGYSYTGPVEDYDFYLRVRRAGIYKFYNLPEKLLQYRIHTGQATWSGEERKNLVIDMTLKLRELFLTGEYKFLIGILVSTRLGKWLVKKINAVKYARDPQ